MKPEVVYIADRDSAQFEQNRIAADVVCAGDSLTGWNNYGPVQSWPYPCYPQFLQESVASHGLRIANCGIAAEISENGVGQVREYLDLFPDARHFIIGFGTNDLGMRPDLPKTSERIIQNLDRMVQAVAERGGLSVLFNVPYANESAFSARIAADLHEKRDYHNARLKDYCERNQIPLADICSKLADEHFGDELHPNGEGAKIIAGQVYAVLNRILQQE